MAVSPSIHNVFGHFQNLNLLVLMQDLRDGQVVRDTWLSGSNLCPVAHGLRNGEQVMELVMAELADVDKGCTKAARRLGAAPAAILRFVRRWDEQALRPEMLLNELEELWRERLDDAEAVQTMLNATPAEAACIS
jgi:hypothetical protein